MKRGKIKFLRNGDAILEDGRKVTGSAARREARLARRRHGYKQAHYRLVWKRIVAKAEKMNDAIPVGTIETCGCGQHSMIKLTSGRWKNLVKK